jgi:heat shock protein 1/8
MSVSKTKVQTAIGIDLGNSYSCVGVYDPDRRFGFQKVAIIPNEQGNRTTPSYVAFTETGRLVGDAAKNQIAANPFNTVWNVKRFIGRRYDDKDLELQHDDFTKNHGRFRIVEEHRRPLFEVETKGLSTRFKPEEITAMIISKLKHAAETYLGYSVYYAVISIPSRFNLAQRQAVRDSAQITGLQVLRLTHSTDLAAMAYCIDNNFEGERKILVFDYGSYSLGVSALTVEEGIVEVKSTHSSNGHCGEEINTRLVNHFVSEFKRKHKKDLTRSARAMSRLRTACERVKCALSSTFQESLEIDSLFEGIDFYTLITRTRFEELCQDYFRECLECVERVLRDDRRDKGWVHEVVLVGGSSRIPKVQKMLSDFFNGKELNKSLNFDEAVAYGASVLASILGGQSGPETDNYLLLPVEPISLGIGTTAFSGANVDKDGVPTAPLVDMGGNGQFMHVLVKRNTTIQTKKSEVISTCVDNQPSMRISILEGERARAKDNTLLQSLVLKSIPPAPRGVPQIEVTFDVYMDNFSVTVVEKGTGKSIREPIYAKDRLSKEEIDRMAAEARRYREEDDVEAARVAAKNELEAFAYSLQELHIGSGAISEEKRGLHHEIRSTLGWLDENQLAAQDEYEDQRTTLETVAAQLTMDGGKESVPSKSDPRIFNQQPTSQGTEETSHQAPKGKLLAEMYRPPFEIISKLDFQQSGEEARKLDKLVLINIQDPGIFDCLIVNRDLWKDPQIRDTIKRRFVFLQFNKENDGASQYIQRYFPTYDKPDEYPHIAIIDPRTEQQVKLWSGPPSPRPEDFLFQLHEFLELYLKHEPSVENDIRQDDSTVRAPAEQQPASYQPKPKTPESDQSAPDTDSEATVNPLATQPRSVEQRLSEYFHSSTIAGLRTGYTDAELQHISSLLRNTGQATWSSVPRIYTVLRQIGQLQLIETFIEDGITDIWFPFTNASLPEVLSPSIRANFINMQPLVITKALEFEKDPERKHAHFDRNELVPFEVRARLGSGASGYVEKVVSLLSHREYARKSFRRRKTFSNQREDIKSFRNELQAFKRISHLHCVELIGSYTDPKYFALIMSPVADCDMSAYYTLAAESPDKLSLLRGFFGCLANALQYLHASQIRHRDIKPQNILVKGPNVFLTDFGIALDWGNLSRSTTTEDSGKTWVYAAPEVAQFQPRNSSTDVWSLGCVFLEMATVLKGEKVAAMRDFFKNRNDDYRFYNNIGTAREWMARLAAPELTEELAPMKWITGMLQERPALRPTAFTLYSAISPDRGPVSFCGPCCKEGNDSSDASENDNNDDDPWADDTAF